MNFYKYFTILFLFFFSSCKSTFQETSEYKKHSIIIKKGEIEGVIFRKEYDCIFCSLGENRYTPVIEDVNLAEEILAKNIKIINNPRYNQGDGCPIIHKNLKNYRRQYFGNIDRDGNKILFINFTWARFTIIDWLQGYEKDKSDNWKTEMTAVLDGCSNHWSIEVNLTKESLQNLMVNGQG